MDLRSLRVWFKTRKMEELISMSDLRHYRAIRHLALAGRHVSPASAILRAREISSGALRLQRVGLKLDPITLHEKSRTVEDLLDLAGDLELGQVHLDHSEFICHLDAITEAHGTVSGAVLRSWLDFGRECVEG